MLFNVLFVVMLIYIILAPFLLVYGIKFGFRIADNPQKEAERPIITKHKKTVKVSKEEQAELDFLNNIYNYNGSNRGQKKIEV